MCKPKMDQVFVTFGNEILQAQLLVLQVDHDADEWIGRLIGGIRNEHITKHFIHLSLVLDVVCVCGGRFDYDVVVDCFDRTKSKLN